MKIAFICAVAFCVCDSRVHYVPDDRRRFREVILFNAKGNLPRNREIFLVFAHSGGYGFDWVCPRHAELTGFEVLGDVCNCCRRQLHGRPSLWTTNVGNYVDSERNSLWLFSFGTIAYLYFALFRRLPPGPGSIDIRSFAFLTVSNPSWWLWLVACLSIALIITHAWSGKTILWVALAVTELVPVGLLTLILVMVNRLKAIAPR